MESSSKSLTRQQKQALWQSRVEAWQTSQLPQEEFCEKEGVNLHTFKYWRQKFNHRKPEVNWVPVSLVPEASSPPSFSAPSFRSSGLRVLVNERLQIEVQPSFDPETLQTLVKTLERL